MKRKFIFLNRYLILLLVLLCAFSMLNLNAYATEVSFPDVVESDYYYEAVTEMHKKGYVLGYTDGEFKPYNNITIGESLTVLFRMSGIEVPKTDNPKYWCEDVINLAKRLNIITENTNYTDFATRLDIANYIIKLYQVDISGVNVSNVFLDTNLLAANIMYQYGIFAGYPSEGGVVFMPYSKITRGELCVVIHRLNDKVKSPYIGNLVFGEYEVPVNPDTVEEYMIIMQALAHSDSLSITIPYSVDLSNISYYLKIRGSAIDAFEQSFAMYPEYFSFTPTLTLKREIYSINSGSIIMTISNDSIDSETILNMREDFNKICEDIVTELYSMEVIDELDSEMVRAKTFYEYVALHCKFDVNYGINSFTGYGAASEGLAVCQGYTAMYNNLCRIDNIIVKGVTGTIVSTGEPHMWSAIYEPTTENWIYCDVTFGDPVMGEGYEDYYDMSYFGMPLEEIMVDRVLDNFS